MSKRSGGFSGLLIVGLALVLSLPFMPLVAEGSSPAPQRRMVLAPANPDFLSFQAKALARSSSDSDRAVSYGLIPSPLDRSQLVGTGGVAGQRMAQSYPSSFDLRTTGKLTGVRNQNPYGTCWAFASLASLESALMPGESWNFSENHLAVWSGFDNAPQGPYNHGGNADMAAAYLARWQGPVNEADSPYIDQATPSVLPVQKHLQQALFHPGRSGPLDNDSAKAAVTTYGAVYTSIYWGDAYYKSSTAAFYYPGSTSPNHAVAIVGWDDNYAASQFSSVPAGNGAFIVRNSWGSGWGDGGYFYISYYDSWVGKELVSFNLAESAGNFSAIYQYDPLGWTNSGGYGGNTGWFANAFTSGDGQSLAAVSFYTPVANASYEIYSGGALSSKQFRKSGTIEFSGYHTIPLDSAVALPSGQGFIVAVKLTTPGYGFPVPMEDAWSGYSSQATAQPGQSYVSSDGTSWTDLTTQFSDANVCLKAFTTGGTPPPSPTISVVSPNGGESWTLGESRAIQWSSANLSGNVAIELSRNGESAWETLFAGTANDGNESWTVAGAPSDTCRVRVTSVSSPEANDTSDGNFAIGDTPPPSPTISVVSPNGGESWTLGESRAIQWSSSEVSGNVAIELSRNGGSAWETLFAGTANDGNESWTVAGAPSDTCRVKVTSVSSPEANDTSDGNFAIGGTPPADPPVLSLPSPNLDFGTSEGQKALTVRNEGGGDLHWNATSAADWISASADSGTIGPHSGIELQISVNRTGKSPGVYQTEIAFSSDGGSQNASVQMEVPQPQPTINVLNPNGGESWTVGESRAIQWSSVNLSGDIKIELSRNGGSAWETLFAGTANDGNESWTVTGPVSTACRVRVTGVDNGTVLDTSNANFHIESAMHEFTFHLVQNWNMISLPLTTSASPSAVFGGLPAGWMIFCWNPLIPGYQMNDQVTLEAGKGYWLKSPSALNYVVSGERFNQSKTASLAVGWNMVGLPYLADVNWGDVHIRAGGATYTLDQAADAGVIARYLFWWNGNQYQTANEVGKLEPGKGYWLQAKQACELLFSPSGVTPPPPPPGNP